MLTPPSDYDHAEVIPGLYVGAFPPVTQAGAHVESLSPSRSTRHGLREAASAAEVADGPVRRVDDREQAVAHAVRPERLEVVAVALPARHPELLA